MARVPVRCRRRVLRWHGEVRWWWRRFDGQPCEWRFLPESPVHTSFSCNPPSASTQARSNKTPARHGLQATRPAATAMSWNCVNTPRRLRVLTSAAGCCSCGWRDGPGDRWEGKPEGRAGGGVPARTARSDHASGPGGRAARRCGGRACPGGVGGRCHSSTERPGPSAFGSSLADQEKIQLLASHLWCVCESRERESSPRAPEGSERWSSVFPSLQPFGRSRSGPKGWTPDAPEHRGGGIGGSAPARGAWSVFGPLEHARRPPADASPQLGLSHHSATGPCICQLDRTLS